jgi:hypothetical protein
MPIRRAEVPMGLGAPENGRPNPQRSEHPGEAKALFVSMLLEAVVLLPLEVVLVRIDLGVHLHFHEFRYFPGHFAHLPSTACQ